MTMLDPELLVAFDFEQVDEYLATTPGYRVLYDLGFIDYHLVKPTSKKDFYLGRGQIGREMNYLGLAACNRRGLIDESCNITSQEPRFQVVNWDDRIRYFVNVIDGFSLFELDQDGKQVFVRKEHYRGPLDTSNGWYATDVDERIAEALFQEELSEFEVVFSVLRATKSFSHVYFNELSQRNGIKEKTLLEATFEIWKNRPEGTPYMNPLGPTTTEIRGATITLLQRLEQAAEYQFGQQLEDYDGPLTPLIRAAKFVNLNLNFNPDWTIDKLPQIRDILLATLSDREKERVL